MLAAWGISWGARFVMEQAVLLYGSGKNYLFFSHGTVLMGVVSENGIYGHSRFCNTDFDDKLACLNLSGV
ncbi:hypothetical protein DCV45_21630 [Salmonella enterica subsp. enterica serovar Heidelberg]|nr:hypothetical protein [Salmonella enterica subsp. enterica serovar Heidelberg]